MSKTCSLLCFILFVISFKNLFATTITSHKFEEKSYLDVAMTDTVTHDEIIESFKHLTEQPTGTDLGGMFWSRTSLTDDPWTMRLIKELNHFQPKKEAIAEGAFGHFYHFPVSLFKDGVRIGFKIYNGITLLELEESIELAALSKKSTRRFINHGRSVLHNIAGEILLISRDPVLAPLHRFVYCRNDKSFYIENTMHCIIVQDAADTNLTNLEVGPLYFKTADKVNYDPLKLRRALFSAIVQLEKMHLAKLTHGDVKSGNMVIAASHKTISPPRPCIFLIDFGFSRELTSRFCTTGTQVDVANFNNPAFNSIGIDNYNLIIAIYELYLKCISDHFPKCSRLSFHKLVNQLHPQIYKLIMARQGHKTPSIVDTETHQVVKTVTAFFRSNDIKSHLHATPTTEELDFLERSIITGDYLTPNFSTKLREFYEKLIDAPLFFSTILSTLEGRASFAPVQMPIDGAVKSPAFVSPQELTQLL